ncbi:EFCAB6 [Bugula neritina]|uniref:EFCAB6 n=1 Tax=Bugula neritina TaxID=10212 RepID=A0A7J7K693_BUGNE|nr:EFCAB6 [Bugula neritina]
MAAIALRIMYISINIQEKIILNSVDTCHSRIVVMAASGEMLTVSRPGTSASFGFRPDSKLRISRPNLSRSQTNLKPIERSSPSPGVVNPNLSSIEVENLLRSQVKNNYVKLLQGFRNYDINRIDAVSKGEFRRVLEAFALSLTSEQFESIIAKVPTDRSGALLYVEFLERFYGKDKLSKDDFAASYRVVKTPVKQPVEVNMDMVEKQLQEKIKLNAKDFIKSFHLFDYNRDGRIQRHDFRKVLDNNAIKLNDSQFEKLWMRYDFHHTGTMDYKDFLRRLGVKIMQPLSQVNKPPSFGVNTRAPAKPANESVSPLKHLNIDQLDREFRRRMRTNYVNVKRALNACDKNNDGFISLVDLRAVLSAFTIPMSEQLFVQLMERAQIKASGQVCWGVVLSKFQDPQSEGNGQSIPIKSNHKYFPVKQYNEEATSDELWNLLHRHVTSAYGSFKNAFLQMDEGHTGRISKKDIKKVLQNFKIRLSKSQLNKLMKRLDPEDSNSIDYQSFLSIFEPRYNEEQKPVILAWDTVDEILCQKLTENWSIISPKLKSYDPLNSAKINKSLLRKIITQYCIPISDDHFNYMISRLEDYEGDKVNYIEWLSKLGVDVQPGDITGLSTQIFNSHNTELDKRYHDQLSRHVETDKNLLDRTAFMTPEEVLIRLRDRMLQHKKSIRDAFLLFDKKNSGKISKKDFKQVLVQQGMLLDDEMFSQVCNLLNFHRGYMDYYSFISSFDVPKDQQGSIMSDIKQSGNHKMKLKRNYAAN